MQIATLLGSGCLLVAALVAPSNAAAGIPPFCADIMVPPVECSAPAARPCTGSCPADDSNHPDQWVGYWGRCPSAQNSDLAKKQFACGSTAHELHFVYYNPVNRWLCCVKNPFSDSEVGGDGGDEEK
jgi:hypothetical protein